jgi:hypothetical protein
VPFRIATIACGLLAVSEPAFAQDRADHAPRMQATRDIADEGAFEAGVADLTVRAAFPPPHSLSRQEWFSLLLLLSVPRGPARNSMQGGKP